MTRRLILLAVALGLLLAPVVHATDPDLVELSKKEKARRAQTGAHKTFTNKDIEAFKAKNKQGGKNASSSTKAVNQPQTQEETSEDTSSEDAPVYDFDKEEVYWRGRYQEAKARIEKAQKEVDRLQPIVDQLKQTYVESKDPTVVTQFQDAVERRTEELESAKKELEAAQQGMDDLEEEGRKAGALPGWFRDQ